MAKFNPEQWQRPDHSHAQEAHELTTLQRGDATSRKMSEYRGYPFAKEDLSLVLEQPELITLYSVKRKLDKTKVKTRLEMWVRSWATAIQLGYVNPKLKPRNG